VIEQGCQDRTIPLALEGLWILGLKQRPDLYIAKGRGRFEESFSSEWFSHLSAGGSGMNHMSMEQAPPFYSPVVATVPAGYRIPWNNKMATVPTVTHDDCLTKKTCAFDSGSVAPGNSFTLTFLEPLPKYCRQRTIMRGAITVIAPKINAERGSNYWISTNEQSCGGNKILCLTKGANCHSLNWSLLH